jgi:hypothetical protein
VDIAIIWAIIPSISNETCPTRFYGAPFYQLIVMAFNNHHPRKLEMTEPQQPSHIQKGDHPKKMATCTVRTQNIASLFLTYWC